MAIVRLKNYKYISGAYNETILRLVTRIKYGRKLGKIRVFANRGKKNSPKIFSSRVIRYDIIKIRKGKTAAPTESTTEFNINDAVENRGKRHVIGTIYEHTGSGALPPPLFPVPLPLLRKNLSRYPACVPRSFQ